MNYIEFFEVFAILFVSIFVVHYFGFTKPKLRVLYEGEKKTKKKPRKFKRKNKKIESVELSYLTYKFKLDKDKLNWKSLAFWISAINSFIISLVVTILELINLHISIKFLIAFVLLFALIYSIYEIYGRILKNKQEKEND